MSWPTARLRPVETNDSDVGFVKGRQVLPAGTRQSQQRPNNSHEQFAALFGYSPNESLLHTRAPNAEGDGTGHQPSGNSSPKSGKGRRSPTRQSTTLNSTEEMQHALGYRTKRKGEHDLTPAQQRAFQFHSAINKSTIGLTPDLNPGSIFDSAAATLPHAAADEGRSQRQQQQQWPEGAEVLAREGPSVTRLALSNREGSAASTWTGALCALSPQGSPQPHSGGRQGGAALGPSPVLAPAMTLEHAGGRSEQASWWCRWADGWRCCSVLEGG
ncbi:hypothetical protein PLESTB_001214600 [Pleodorina starrii]|uniref:Uncharacterized protein n=1 Tax=Pleodorina starrii TaxID=330485 RepID=A0A9W6F6B4_9CHLO|nr:hypothetical protein PLESTB_001214600 [Pleodorina starrii]